MLAQMDREIRKPREDGRLLLFAEPKDLIRARPGREAGPVRLLVVDGWSGDYHLLVENLRDFSDSLDLTWVDRAEKAIDLLCGTSAASRPDILLIDPVLPGIDGWEVLEELWLRNCHEGLAVVVQASERSDFLLRRCRELGVEAAIEKPVAADSFRRLLAALGFNI